jgi:hypothetical protein
VGRRFEGDRVTDLARAAFARSIVRGLDDNPRWLSCRYLYDAAGSDLFERITEQPEYYLTRVEAALLARTRATSPHWPVRRRSSSSAPARRRRRGSCSRRGRCTGARATCPSTSARTC